MTRPSISTSHFSGIARYHLKPNHLPVVRVVQEIKEALDARNQKPWMKEQMFFKDALQMLMRCYIWGHGWKREKTSFQASFGTLRKEIFEVMCQELNVPKENLEQIIAERSKVKEGLRECYDFCSLLSEFFC